jgi:hypothetical protein
MKGYRPVKAVPSILGATDGSGQYLDSDGNRVNVGNFDSDRLSVGMDVVVQPSTWINTPLRRVSSARQMD